MFEVDWQRLKDEDLKDADHLEKIFRKFLCKECKYSVEEAKFAADIIREPFRRNYNNTLRTYVATTDISGTIYEIYFCSNEDSADRPFEFYTLVEVASKVEAHYGDQLLPYITAKKKFILPSR